MEKVALSIKEEYRILSSIFIECYRGRINEWSLKEKRTFKVLFKYISKVFDNLPLDEIWVEKIDLVQVYEFLFRSFGDLKEVNYETQGLGELVSEFEEVIKLYSEVLQGVRGNFLVKYETRGIQQLCLNQVSEEFDRVKEIECLFNKNIKKLEDNLNIIN